MSSENYLKQIEFFSTFFLLAQSEKSDLCYDEKLDPKGEKYKGSANTTESGRTCQVFTKERFGE